MGLGDVFEGGFEADLIKVVVDGFAGVLAKYAAEMERRAVNSLGNVVNGNRFVEAGSDVGFGRINEINVGLAGIRPF